MAEHPVNVLALGAGEIGWWAARTIARDDRVEELVVADRNLDAAESAVAAVSARARAERVDVTDSSALRTLLRGADVVVNTVGPYYRFGVPVLRATLEAGCHYLDVCDDWEPTLEMLDLDADAKAAGVTAVIGLGASPGVSNLLAAKAIAALDSAESVLTVWSLDAAVPDPAPPGAQRQIPSAATVHGVHQMTGRIRAFEAGREILRRPLERIQIDYPGIGRAPAWTIGHPEAVTLPRAFPTLQRSVNAMFSRRSTIAALELMMSLVNLRLASVERVAAWVERLESLLPIESPVAALESGEPRPTALPPMFALASGTRRGKPESVAVALTSAPAGGMGAITGIPLALGVSLLADGALARPGVFSPEAIVEPDALLDKLRSLCEPVAAQAALMTSSWDEVPFWDALREVRSRNGD